jgi:hypothetical protein
LYFRGRGLEVVVCYSGPVSYDFDRPDVALEGKLGVTMPDGHLGVLDAATRIIVVIGRV